MSHRHRTSFPDAKPVAKKDKKPPEIGWKDVPDDTNFRAASKYLTLILPAPLVTASVSALRSAGTQQWNPHDLLRAARLKPAKADDPTYLNELGKVENGEPWSPILLVAMFGRLVIADGYHRTSVAYDLGEQQVWARVVPCHDEDGDE